MCELLGRTVRVLCLLPFALVVFFAATGLAAYIDIFGVTAQPMGVNGTMTPAQRQDFASLAEEVFRTGYPPAEYTRWGWVAVGLYVLAVAVYFLWAVYKTGSDVAACCIRCGRKQRRRRRAVVRSKQRAYEPLEEVGGDPDLVVHIGSDSSEGEISDSTESVEFEYD